ncbi:hypothetical protein ACIBW9_37340 [Streptomyces sp. NPDC049541]|uniref:hypothetical protein n=1 Tax=Streptomyces sp. NPDC049541 TaxID=3365594 RepID=UPI00378EE636
MPARDLARPYPTVPVDYDAREAARLVVRERLTALLVIDRGTRTRSSRPHVSYLPSSPSTCGRTPSSPQ